MIKTPKNVSWKDIKQELINNNGEQNINIICGSIMDNISDETAIRTWQIQCGSSNGISNAKNQDGSYKEITDYSDIMKYKIYCVKKMIWDMIYRKVLEYTDGTKTAVRIVKKD